MENETDEFRLQNYRAMENRLLSANSDVKHLTEELASLKDDTCVCEYTKDKDDLAGCR